MITLRGKLQRDSDRWKWSGLWAFGRDVHEKNSLPFSYAFEQAVSPSQVPLPVANEDDEDDEGAEDVRSDTRELSTNDKDASEQEPGRTTKSGEPIVVEATPVDGTDAQHDQSAVSKKRDSHNLPPEKHDSLDSCGEDNSTRGSNGDEENAVMKCESARLRVEVKTRATFADKEKPDDPDFTDASTKHQCPESGQWKGYFETLLRRNKTQVHETCHIFLNCTPPAGARIFFDGDNSDLPSGHVHARGAGENQYGTFQLVGSLNLETMTLQCHRMYVVTLTPTATPRSRGPRSGANKTPESNESDGRPYYTRKRQMSWKKRASLAGDEEEDSKPKRKRVRSESTASSVAAVTQKLSIMIPGASLPTDIVTDGVASVGFPHSLGPSAASLVKRPSPRAALSPTSKKSSAASGPASRAAVPSSSTATVGHMKLPSAGDPHKARWRAAHFLYYHRHDPSDDGINLQSTGPTAHSTIPKYVVYEGDLLHSHRDGRGVCLYNNGMLYEGEWKRDKEHGQGTLMSADRKRIIYKGEWERGRMHGKGTYYYGEKRNKKDAGTRYEGEFKENLRHGTGSYFLKDGSLYVGNWRDGMMSGRGVFTWPDGSVYDGEWKDGKRHGLGILRASDGFVYDGAWSNNSMEGRGSATYPNGQQYVGLFTAGRRDGRGTMLFTNGAIYEGRFRDDAVDGQGTLRLSRALVVPRSDIEELEGEREEPDEENRTESSDGSAKKDDFMIPLSFQSDMTHIHRKAGFTLVGD